MTLEAGPTSTPEREVDDEERRFYRNLSTSLSRGIRQKTLKRVVALSTVIQYDYRTGGPASQQWIERKDESAPEQKEDFVCALGPDDFDILAESAREIFPESDVEFLTDVSDRTAWDYLKTLQYFILSSEGLGHLDRLQEQY
jgi:hypothetical protein